jgi:hypothetical protein
MRLYLQKEKVEKAIAKAGSVAALSRAMGTAEKSIRRWHAGLEMTLASQAKLNQYLEA